MFLKRPPDHWQQLDFHSSNTHLTFQILVSYIWHLTLVITVPANALVPDGAEQLKDKVMNANFIFFSLFPVTNDFVLLDTSEVILTQWYHVVTKIWVNIGSSNGLLPEDIKPLPEPMLTWLLTSIPVLFYIKCWKKSIILISNFKR